MRAMVLSTFCLTALGCAAAEHVPRARVVPPLQLATAPVDPARDQAPRTESDRSPPTTSARPEFVAPSSFAAPSPPVYRTVVQTVEVPVEVATRTATADDGWDGYAGAPYRQSYYPGYYGGYYGYYGPGGYREPAFPINTAIGAGIGAIIGNQNGRRARGRGALIGGGIGLLFDLERWLRR